MEAAIAELRASLGPDAIILNSERGRNGNITLRAALEHVAAEANAENSAIPDDSNIIFDQDDQDTSSLIDQALSFHRAPAAIHSLLLEATQAWDTDDAVLALAAALETRYSFSPLPVRPLRPLLLIGPAGAGKTVTAAKLAARSVLAGHKTVLITTDLVRAGGADQLAMFANSMQASMYRAANAVELAELEKNRDADTACIIDTTGASPYNLTDLKSLKNLIMAIDCDPVLVLPAGGDSMEACEIANIYSGLGARGLIVTKLDVTRRMGSIIAALEGAAMVLHHVSITPYVANGLAPINAAGLARLLLEDPIERKSFSDLERTAQ